MTKQYVVQLERQRIRQLIADVEDAERRMYSTWDYNEHRRLYYTFLKKRRTMIGKVNRLVRYIHGWSASNRDYDTACTYFWILCCE